MVSRIETLEDLMTWLECLSTLHTKNVSLQPISKSGQISLNQAKVVIHSLVTKFPTPFKQCCKCKRIWPETREWFDWCGQGRTGLHSICKFCRNSYQKTHKKQQRTQRKAPKKTFSASAPQQPPAPGELY